MNEPDPIGRRWTCDVNRRPDRVGSGRRHGAATERAPAGYRLAHQTECVGLYNLVEGKVVNGKPVWRHATAGNFLAFSSANRWFCQTESDLGADKGWLHLSDASAASPDRSAVVWNVHDGEAWVEAPTLRCVSADHEPPPTSLRLEGTLAHKTEYLGLYNLVEGKVVNGKPVWRHATAGNFLAFSSANTWMCQAESGLPSLRPACTTAEKASRLAQPHASAGSAWLHGA